MFTEGLTSQQTRTCRDSVSGRRVHFIGISGCGMQGAAAVLGRLGATVSGSDLNTPEDSGALQAAGISLRVGHRAENITPDMDFVVYSAAIPAHNPELVEAMRLAVPTVSYARLLGRLMERWTGIAIAGTHGKSTTTGMTAWIFREAGLAPSFIVGADSLQLGGRSGVGSGRHFIVEACEYKRSFLHFRPSIAAVLNIEADHLDYYRDMDDLVEAFNSFCANVSSDGLIVIPHDDEMSRRAVAEVEASVETFGTSENATWRPRFIEADHGRYEFDVLRNGRLMMRAKLGLAGAHNMFNALAASLWRR